jgi:UDP-glucose 4-epimerase
MKALVTGGAGFIGSHLAEALCRRGIRVVVLDNLSSGNLHNLDWRGSDDGLKFIKGDIRDEKILAKVVPGCDWVFHQAAVSSVPYSVAMPLESNAHNLEGTLNLLVVARDAGVKRFLYASSAAIYGDDGTTLRHEGLPPNPLSPYALQKYGSEKYAQLFHHLYGLETVVLRYFNIFGPRQAFASPYSGVIATGQSITLLQLVAELNRLTGRRLQPRFKPLRSGDVRFSRSDISAARRDLGYESKTTWEQGLAATLEHYRKNPVSR